MSVVDAIWRQDPDELMEMFMAFGTLLLVGTSSYMRGRLDESSLEVVEFCQQMAANGPYWPIIGFSIGLVVSGAAFITWWTHRDE